MKKHSFCSSVAMFVLIAVMIVPSVALAAPVLISQPAYNGMRFYVHRPYNIPEGWYATYDGYPVFKNGNGVWFYGSAAGAAIVPTSYVVGSVVPSVVGIVPWTTAPAMSVAPVMGVAPAVSVAPAASTLGAAVPVLTSQPIVSVKTPPAVTVAEPVAVTAPVVPVYTPAWTTDPDFLAIGTWDKSVGCIGVLRRPAVPVAWKGKYPRVIYAWTGYVWYQITCREYERPVDALRRELYTIMVMVNKNNSHWRDEDMALLPQYAAVWGYEWMGQIVLAH